MEKTSQSFRAGYVAIIGEPNVGKSTLMNGLLQRKISIVTPKPQTTRHKILGILSGADYQIIFLDTPGILKPEYLLQEAMMKLAQAAIDDADMLLLVTDVTRAASGNTLDLDAIHRARKTTFLALNKIDLVKKALLLPIMDFYSKQFSFKEIFPISALTLEGVSELRNALVGALPEHPPFYPADMVSDQPERFFVSEIIREKIFRTFRQEIPYSTTVEIVEFKERDGRKDFIVADIYVERQSQKGILIGKGGQALKEIGELGRKEVEEFLGRPVFLELHVKVREKWRESEAWLKRLGYGHQP